MTKEEYLKELGDEKNRHQIRKKELIKQYALYNNPYKIGDIITDHIGTIEIEKISVYLNENNPTCIYYGICYTKTGRPYKNNRYRKVYQMNLKV